MRPLSRFLIIVLLAMPALAAGTIHFDPPDPTSRTPVLAHIALPACGLGQPTVTRHGSIIDITVTQADVCPASFTADLGVLPAGVYDVIVGEPTILIGLAEATLVVRDAAPPFVVEPDVVTAGFDGNVHLIGSSIVGCAVGPSPIVCEHVDVRFGDALAQVVSTSPGEIVVKPPASLAPGTYDVSIFRTTQILTAHAAFHVAAPDEPPSSAFYERVLFPVFFSGPGALGSNWQTTAMLSNGNDFAWTAAQPSIFPSVPPHATATATGTSTSAGVLEFAPRQAIGNASFALNVRDLSRQSQDLGTEIPVVRESELRDRAFSLLNVPADPRYRVTLRVYDVDGPRQVPVRIWQTRPDGDRLLAESITLFLTAQPSLHGGGFAIVNDLIGAYPQLAGNGPLRIELLPFQPPDAKTVWAFASITNNDTQHVTIVTPQ
jgi:hypothetical protein